MEELDDTAIGTIWNRRVYAAIGCECRCGRKRYVMLWQGLCKRGQGIKPLKQVKERLRCSSCGERPVVAVLLRYEELAGWR
ncbi:hypothetical protein [Thalassospira aquimaris]|uniref:Uncharacterized protein n=1 Tax=Thalassospira aquimaris TaxID=3037796 RepID=A0ABT6GGE1_9PROT|nr:hypothetical protein [Thalassospira sp. FZY0004]MDG4721166.1 hypothetical protein [Thalassospira sp. FZY0004]